MNEGELYQIGIMFRKYFNSEDYTKNIEEHLKDMVLTGEEIMRMSEYFHTEVEKKYEELPVIAKIEKIIKGKKGTIIDEIRKALEEKDE